MPVDCGVMAPDQFALAGTAGPARLPASPGALVPDAAFYDYLIDAVTFAGVFHTSRDPEKWRRRLP